LGRNQDGYRGERIEIAAVLAETIANALRLRLQVDRLPAGSGRELLFLRRPCVGTKRIYISAGIHGDEPAGPLAVARLLARNCLPAHLDLCLCPCLNPTGFSASTRENAEGIDLNRDYLNPVAAETQTHVAWLQAQPAFDLTLCLHEDWEARGFYVYEVNPESRPSLAEHIVEAARPVCPVDLSAEIDGRPARGGIIRPDLDPATRRHWPEAFWLIQNKTRLSYTLEAPSDFPLDVRVTALVDAVRVALAEV
jgi:hypothetical protein